MDVLSSLEELAPAPAPPEGVRGVLSMGERLGNWSTHFDGEAGVGDCSNAGEGEEVTESVGRGG